MQRTDEDFVHLVGKPMAPTLPMGNVRALTLRQIAKLWAPEQEYESIVLRELRLAVVNIPRMNRNEAPIDPTTPDDQLPDPDQAIADRDWTIEFCRKQGWELPEFWFGKLDPQGDRYPGRPSVKSAILQELRRRGLAADLEATLAEQSRVLAAWAAEKFPGTQTPTPKTVENQIRSEFIRLKHPH